MRADTKMKKSGDTNMLHLISDIINELGLSDTKTQYDSLSGTASITGLKNGIRCTTTLKPDSEKSFGKELKNATTIGREAAIEQVKELYRQGYRQVDIARMLNISQSTVSLYVRK